MGIYHSASLFSLLLSQNWIIIIGAVVAFLLTYGLTFAIIALCRRVALFNRREEGKLYTGSVPRLGGVGVFLAFLIAALCFYFPSLNPHDKQEIIFGHSYPKELIMSSLFIIASLLIVAIHAYDDIKGLKPLTKLLAQTVAVLILLGPGLHTFHGVLFFGVNNPFVPVGAGGSELTLFIQGPVVSWLAIPAVLFTWFWVVGMMNAINFIDGLDGLAGGIVAIVGLFITIISWRLGQNSIAILSAIFTGAVAGFLPHNWNPARIIMGDSGAQFLGLALAVLAVIGGAKFALVLMILGIPILDIALVMLNRLRRGQNPMKSDILQLHYRKTHLHYRFLFGGLNARQICYILYSVTFVFGLLALQLPRIYKFLGFALVGIVMISLLIWSSRLQNKREIEKQQEVAPEKQG
jgi:UDP-GlcNAc:undecaprenyl-phosphate/decaprenyl-phosphate GlcNAc-1-phosphate transferase